MSLIALEGQEREDFIDVLVKRQLGRWTRYSSHKGGGLVPFYDREEWGKSNIWVPDPNSIYGTNGYEGLIFVESRKRTDMFGRDLGYEEVTVGVYNGEKGTENFGAFLGKMEGRGYVSKTPYEVLRAISKGSYNPCRDEEQGGRSFLELVPDRYVYKNKGLLDMMCKDMELTYLQARINYLNLGEGDPEMVEPSSEKMFEKCRNKVIRLFAQKYENGKRLCMAGKTDREK